MKLEIIKELEGLGPRYGKKLEQKVMDILNKENFWKNLTSLDEKLKILESFEPKNVKLFIEIKDKNLLKILQTTSIFKTDKITFNSEEYKINEKCLTIEFENLFDKYSIEKLIDLFFPEKKDEFFFSKITELYKNPIISLYTICYLDDISNFCTEAQKFDNETKEECYQCFKKHFKKIEKQIELIIERGTYYPFFSFTSKGLSEKNIFDLNTLELNYFERNLLIMENFLFNNIILTEDLYSQDYIFSFNANLNQESLIIITFLNMINYHENFEIPNKFKNTLIKGKYFDKINFIAKFYNQIQILQTSLDDFLFAYMFHVYKKELYKYTGYNVSYRKTLKKWNPTYLKKHFDEIESLLTKDDEIILKFCDLLLLKNIFNDISKLNEELRLENDTLIEGKEYFNELIRAIDFEKRIEKFLSAPSILKILVINKSGEEKLEKFLEEDNNFENFIKSSSDLVLYEKFNLNFEKLVDKFYNPWNVNLENKIKQFSKFNTQSLFYNNIDKFLEIELELNSNIFEEIKKRTTILPTSNDVYFLLKSIITGNSDLIRNKDLKRFFRDKNKYKRIIILVFDGLGYALLRWGSYFFKELKNILEDENNYSIIQAKLPTLTGVNHIALLSGKEAYEDNFFKRLHNSSFEKIEEGKKFKTYRITTQAEFELFDTTSDLFSYVPENYLFVTAHKTRNLSFLSRVIARSIKIDDVEEALQYTAQIGEALKSNKKVIISQVNVFDQFIEDYSKIPTKDIYALWNFYKPFLGNVKDLIKNHLKEDSLLIITADHGLTWVKSQNVINIENLFSEKINEKLKNFKITGFKKEYSPNNPYLKIIINGGEIGALFFPPNGPRRVASFYLIEKGIKEELYKALNEISEGRFLVKKIDTPRHFDPDIVLVLNNHILHNKKYSENKFYTGQHGGISIHEVFTPLIIFDYKTWRSYQK